MERLFKAENLMNGYYDEGTGVYDLEFTNGWIKHIPASEHPEAATDEDYWEDQLHIDWAIDEGEWEVNQDDLKVRIQEALEDLDEEIKNTLYDAYIQKDGFIWLEPSGMAYLGDDKKAMEVAQVENGEVINWE